MGLDDIDIGGYEGVGESGNSAESGNYEVSEKFKESVKKAGAKAQKIRKDEKKAKKYDFMLSSFLVKIILNKDYDDLLQLLFVCLDSGYPSNFLLGIFSLVYKDISYEIRKNMGKEIYEFNYKLEENVDFIDDLITTEIKNRINFWIEDMVDVVLIDSSDISTKKLLDLIEEKKEPLDNFFIGIFIFFFKTMNINISQKAAFNYIDFIELELKKSYKDYFYNAMLENGE